MGFLNHVKIWNDVLDPRLDEKAAPSLGGVHLGKEEVIYSDPMKFFRRTLITKHMAEALENVANVLLEKGGNKLLMLLSLFGGGKTHTLLTIYHAFRNPTTLLEAKTEDNEISERLRKLVEELSKAGNVRVVVLDGFFSELTPTPVNPLVTANNYKVQTIWGSLAHQLGRFDEVKENDEKIISPPADVLVKLLGNEPLLILIDELVDYVIRLKTSGDLKLQNYADQVLSFMENLVKAVDLSRRAVLIISLPTEERREGLKVEERYKSQLGVVTSLYKSVSRVASRKILPVAPSDIPSILKVRIFESVDVKAAKAISSTLAKLYGIEENKEIFGEDAVKKAHQIETTYPFHPSYIETLVDVVDKHESLEKTRDAIRITRKVVRKLAEANNPTELIMPFHIDVEDREIRGTLFSHELYRQYETVVEEDIVTRAKNYEKPELVKIIAKTILLKTFVYVGSIKQHQLYPNKYEVIISSFEPSMARTLNLQPKDYSNALEWASSNLIYMLSEGGRYWFVQFASPIRRVEMTAQAIDDHEALKKVEEYAWKLLTKPYEEVASSSRKHGRKETERTPFNVAVSAVLTEPKPMNHDSRDYVLVTILSPIPESEVEKIIYLTPSGGLRRYANTIYLIYPRHSANVSQMLSFAKRLIACGMVEKELDSLYTDSEVREVMSKKLEKYCKGTEGIEGQLLVNILAGLNYVAYPSFDENTHRNTFKVVDATMADTIVETAARALKTARPPKLYDELDFEQLDYMLSQVGTNLSEGELTRLASDIVDYFYSNPRLPMIREEIVKNALIDGVRSLRVGVKKSGRIFFKRIHECRSKQECSPPSVEEGEVPRTIESEDLILPWRIALQEQLEGLKEVKEEKIAGGIRRTWHAFYINGTLIPITEALKSFDLETLRYSPLVKITEFIEEGVDIKLDKYEVTALPNEEITITVFVERIGKFEGEVLLEVTEGSLSTDKTVINDENPSATLEWRLRTPEKQGRYSYEVKAIDSSGKVLRTASLIVIVSPKEREGCREGVPQKGTKLSLIKIEVNTLSFKPLRVIDVKFSSECYVETAEVKLEAEIAGRKPKVTLRLDDVALEDVKNLFSSIAQRYGVSLKYVWYQVTLKPRKGEYIVTPEFAESEVKELENYMTYCVFEGE